MKTITPLPKPAKLMLVTPGELATFAEKLFGLDWRAPLARALYVDVRTVYRWEQEEHGARSASLTPTFDVTGLVGCC
jgi:hypothetical protein